MFTSKRLGVLIGALLVIAWIPDDVTAYSKYGRTCKDIGCLSDEVCEIVEDPCTMYSNDKCGRYPTCRKTRVGEANCATKQCQSDQYCKMENGQPKCISTSGGVGYESAGVSYVNGQRVNKDDTPKSSSTNSNSNPYGNANAPPLPPPDPHPVGGGGYHQMNSGTNLGYPPYPSNTGTSGGHGYPPYPSTGNRQTDLGYPPDPPNNRMPMPGQPAGYPNQNYPSYSSYPGYPQAPGYPQQYPNGQRYPSGQYPGYHNYPHNYPAQGHRTYGHNSHSVYRGAGDFLSASVISLCLSMVALLFIYRT